MLRVASAVVVFLATAPLVSAQNLDRDDVEKPKYTILGHIEHVELRRYDPYIVAEVTVDGDEDSAMNKGFRPLADYIFGANSVQDEIAMTSPVLQQSPRSEEIAMTTPVLQSGGTPDGANPSRQTVQFVMPSEYSVESLPKPNNAEITIKPVPGFSVAVISFSGIGGMNEMLKKEAELREILERHDIAVVAAAMYARYDPPWTPAAKRLNEVMLPVGDDVVP